MKTSRRPRPLLVASILVAALGVSACESDPSAKRVAEDLVKTLTLDQPEVRECMLDVLDGYTKDELERIGNDANGGDQAEQAEAREALEQFEAELASCDPQPAVIDE